MELNTSNSRFLFSFLSSWLIFFLLAIISYFFSPYESFPMYGVFGYSMVIGLLLVALNFSERRLHYLLMSFSLILAGAFASFDIILSKDELANAWFLWELFPLTDDHVDGYVQVLIILLNIFTGSLAANSLFYALNKKNFE